MACSIGSISICGAPTCESALGVRHQNALACPSMTATLKGSELPHKTSCSPFSRIEVHHRDTLIRLRSLLEEDLQRIRKVPSAPAHTSSKRTDREGSRETILSPGC
jgi:hypothetical protein